jgi:hypothetical protein
MYFTSLYWTLHVVANRDGIWDIRRRQSVFIHGAEVFQLAQTFRVADQLVAQKIAAPVQDCVTLGFYLHHFPLMVRLYFRPCFVDTVTLGHWHSICRYFSFSWLKLIVFCLHKTLVRIPEGKQSRRILCCRWEDYLKCSLKQYNLRIRSGLR